MSYQKFNLLDRFLRYLRTRQILHYIKEEQIICDLACGDGSVLKFLSLKIKAGYGVDKNISEFQEKNLHFKYGDINKSLSFENEKFDIVLLLAALEHLECPTSVFNNTWRVLKKGGLFILTTPAPHSQFLLEFLAFKLKIISENEIQDHKNYYSKEKLINLFKKYGFKIVKLKLFCLGFNILAVVQK